MRDVRWLISVNRLAVRAVVSWSCYIKTKTCPMINCEEDETLQHLLMVWSLLRGIGLVFNVRFASIKLCILDEGMGIKQRELYQMMICIPCMKMCKTRCKMTLKQTVICSNSETDTEGEKRPWTNPTLPWGILSLTEPHKLNVLSLCYLYMYT